MIVVVGKRIFTSKNVPIMVYLTEGDKKNIGRMSPKHSLYGEFDKGIPDARARNIIREMRFKIEKKIEKEKGKNG